ncbi:glycine cleavage system aminomethyltransferase GcvT [Pseudooceanicola sp. CBS1P-1]|uniref:aminomethyltransferase n=1 Tax=Pseudooceanicola albus TaxID=2692189 RepID=A0A6L7G3X6_9RHOB|nr:MULTISPECIES: glycine cleavage system aminomethyltransferase GcvT [Pseudooceanicola]MBT9384681.1 glycine cleavage system aminomethyltransferase GcvT [Pseudooceanicola endophyticus]MXN18382.1 glycine cleavage system aminomethyltransferase GcvT [Pseudooceanicola albus]
MSDAPQDAPLTRLKLHDLHAELGAKMVPFAGHEMPVQYATGVMKEHLHTRAAAGLFDVSHMGQVILKGADPETLALGLESLIPAAVLGLGQGRQRYGLLTNEAGGIRDDLMFANRGDHLFVVVNAACKAADISHMREALGGIEVVEITDRCLLALQGPGAEAALAALAPEVAQMRFMDVASVTLAGAEAWVSRSGYTGEDGFEISVPAEAAEALARALLAQEGVLPIGLGARDSLRLEAGLCLYGHDINEETTPLEAGLGWSIQKARRKGGARAGGFPGAERILAEVESGPARLRVGLRPEGRAPMREGVALFDGETPVGAITSGAFGPSLQAPVSMGYVPTALCAVGTKLAGELRGRMAAVTVDSLPFLPAQFKR